MYYFSIQTLHNFTEGDVVNVLSEILLFYVFLLHLNPQKYITTRSS